MDLLKLRHRRRIWQCALVFCPMALIFGMDYVFLLHALA
jgi:hypothetical protein